jgi:hypothetical protein
VRELPCGARARVAFSPPLAPGSAGDDTEYSITAASCTWTLDRLPKIDYSELVRDADYLIRGSA